MNVLSLFDGMSCGQIALNRVGVEYTHYYASEIDPYAIRVTQKNFPNTVQIGDVLGVKSEHLPEIKLLIGGSPCQGFSFAGKQLNFNDPRSMLFFEYVRLLRELKPKYFLLENVKMKKEHQNIISNFLGVEPIEINSSLVSAQNRIRLYWTNIPVTQPDDKKIILSDILVDDDTESLRHTKKALDYMNRSESRWGYGYIQEKSKNKAKCLTANIHKGVPYNVLVIDKSNPPSEISETTLFRKLSVGECEILQTVPLGYTCGVSDTQRYKMLGNGWTVDIIAHILKGLLTYAHT